MKALKTSLFYSIALTIGLASSVLFLTSFKNSDVKFHKSTTHTVVIQGMKFDPEEIHIKKGDVVEWINKDIVPHDVTEIDKKWTSRPLNTGQKWSKKITESAAYFCSIHVVMKGNVIVSD